MAKLNTLLKVHFESQDGLEEQNQIDNPASEESEVEALEAEQELHEETEELEQGLEVQAQLDEVVEQQEANIQAMDGNSVNIEGTPNVEPSIQVKESTVEEMEETSDAIDEQMQQEIAVMENLSGKLGFRATLKKSAFEELRVAVESNTGRQRFLDVANESRFKTGRDRYEHKKELYKLHYEGILDTAKKFAGKVWEGLKSLVQKVIEFITGWFKTDYVKEGKNLKARIEALLKSKNLELSNKLTNLERVPDSVYSLMFLDNPKALYSHLHVTGFLIRHLFSTLDKFNPQKSEEWINATYEGLKKEYEKLKGQSEKLMFSGLKFNPPVVNGPYSYQGQELVKFEQVPQADGFFTFVPAKLESKKEGFSSPKEALEQAYELADTLVTHSGKMVSVVQETNKELGGLVGMMKKTFSIETSGNTNDRGWIRALNTYCVGLVHLSKSLPLTISLILRTSKFIVKNVKGEGVNDGPSVVHGEDNFKALPSK